MILAGLSTSVSVRISFTRRQETFRFKSKTAATQGGTSKRVKQAALLDWLGWVSWPKPNNFPAERKL